MEERARAMDEEQLINDCILPNFPRKWEREFEINGGGRLNTIRDVTEKLLKLNSGK